MSTPPPAPRDNALTPSELARSARLHIEQKFNEVWITGELSNFRRPSSGHWYFSVKDDAAQIRCAMFVNRNRFASLQPKDGLQVLMRGRVSLYEARGDFQVIVDHMEPAGEGALRLAYEALLKQLHKEGLTAEDRKQPLPEYPAHIGVITSGSGAALQDMLSVWHRRYPVAQITLLDVAVQGPNAEADILDALNRARHIDLDVLILSRGGGSLEDLWTFNMERVARAFAECPIPTVSAIGHEIDVAITDYVADVRAPTPSAAAELSTPDITTLLATLDEVERSLLVGITSRINAAKADVRNLRTALVSPKSMLAQWMQRADDLAHRANRAIAQRLQGARQQTTTLTRALQQQHPARQMQGLEQHVHALSERLASGITRKLQRRSDHLQALARTLDAVSPLHTLGRGYAIITTPTGDAVSHINAINAGDAAQVHLGDGYAEVEVTATLAGAGLGARSTTGDSQ